MNDFIEKFEEFFDKEISTKTSWGKNEVLKIKDSAIKRALLETIMNGKLK